MVGSRWLQQRFSVIYWKLAVAHHVYCVSAGCTSQCSSVSGAKIHVQMLSGAVRAPAHNIVTMLAGTPMLPSICFICARNTLLPHTTKLCGGLSGITPARRSGVTGPV